MRKFNFTTIYLLLKLIYLYETVTQQKKLIIAKILLDQYKLNSLI